MSHIYPGLSSWAKFSQPCPNYRGWETLCYRFVGKLKLQPADRKSGWGSSTVCVVVVTVVRAINGASIPGRVPHVRLRRTWAENGFFQCFHSMAQDPLFKATASRHMAKSVGEGCAPSFSAHVHLSEHGAPVQTDNRGWSSNSHRAHQLNLAKSEVQPSPSTSSHGKPQALKAVPSGLRRT